MNWYQIQNEAEIDSPNLLIYPDRIQHNINCMLEKVGGDPKRLCPHVKTHKMKEVVQMQLEAGIERFKCATIAELEMTLSAGVKEIVVAYQLVGPNIQRLVKLAQQYPDANIASLVDNLDSAVQLAAAFEAINRQANVYLDVDNGMHRSGFPLNEDTFLFIQSLDEIPFLNFKGLHVYDGQFRSANVEERIAKSHEAFQPVYALCQHIEGALGIQPIIISGGSPSFSAASERERVYCSPGTTLFWDFGYSQMVSETPYQWAALLMTRVISKPTNGIITLDLGHKAVGSENPLSKRIHFLNLEDYEAIGHSEEHLVLRVQNWEAIRVGDVFYGVPYHVCPSVALHEEAQVVQDNRVVETWSVVARKRKISV